MAKKLSLSKAEIRELNQRISFGFQLPVKGRVEVLFLDMQAKLILLESRPVLFEAEGKILPTLMLLQEQPGITLKKITVDMGAVRFVANGADIMRPGIVAFDDGIEAGDVVVVVDQNFGKNLAVGLALAGSVEMKSMDMGKAVKNLHYVGDRIWNFNREKQQ